MSQYIKTPPRTPIKKGNSLLLGVIIGTLIGVGVAVGVVLFLNRSPSPFNLQQTASLPASYSAPLKRVESNEPEVLHPEGSKVVELAPNVSSKQTASISANASYPHSIDYDFYKILPDNDDPRKKNIPLSDEELLKKPVIEKKLNLEKPIANETPNTEANKKSYLQLGLFRNMQKADNLKAQLALSGIEVHIQKDKDEEGLYRVILGPFNSPEQLTQARQQLKQEKIKSTVVNF